MFSYSEWSRQNGVGLDGYEVEGGQAANIAGVKVGLEGEVEVEVEVVQALVVGQSGEFEGIAETAALAPSDLFFQDQVQEVAVAQGVAFGTLDQGGGTSRLEGAETAQVHPGLQIQDHVGPSPFGLVVLAGRRTEG